MDEEKDDIKKIQKSIEDILGTESGLAKKRPTVKDRKRELFNTIVSGLAHINGRSLSLKHDYKIDFIEYDDMFFVVIDSLMKLHFNKDQRSIIEWFAYEKFLPSGDILVLNDAESGDEIPTDTPDDIWELIQKYEEKNSN